VSIISSSSGAEAESNSAAGTRLVVAVSCSESETLLMIFFNRNFDGYVVDTVDIVDIDARSRCDGCEACGRVETR
jgi:hypothetical protein